MIELTRAEDPVFISRLKVRLQENGITAHVFDGYTSSAYAGALGAVASRIMVGDTDFDRARRVLAEISDEACGTPDV